MSGNYGRPERGPPPTTTTPYTTSSSQYYTADGQYSSQGSSYPTGGQPFYDYGAGSGFGQQPAYAGMSNNTNQLAPTGAPGGGLPPLSTFNQGAQDPSNFYRPPPANRGPPPAYQTGMSMPSNNPPYPGRGRSSIGTGEAPVLRPNRGGSPIRRRRNHKSGSNRGPDSIAAASGGGQALASVGAPPNPIQGFGPAFPAGLAAPPPQYYPQGSHGQGYAPQQPGNQYLGPRHLGQFHLSTSQPQVGSSNDLGQLESGAQVPQPKRTTKGWKQADKELLIRMRNVKGMTFAQIAEALGCTESEASSQHENLQRQSDAKEEARDRVSALASSSNPVPQVERKARGVIWTRAAAVWMEQRFDTLRRSPENKHKSTREVLEMVAAEINFVNGTTVSPSVVEGTLSKLSAEKSGHIMEWG